MRVSKWFALVAVATSLCHCVFNESLARLDASAAESGTEAAVDATRADATVDATVDATDDTSDARAESDAIVDVAGDTSDAADARDASVPGDAMRTSLEGTVACGSSTCTAGQVCVARAPGIPPPDGGGISLFYSCVALPEGCGGVLYDFNGFPCASGCAEPIPACLVPVCFTPVTQVTGRTVYCQGI